jgi:hypothetical protein
MMVAAALLAGCSQQEPAPAAEPGDNRSATEAVAPAPAPASAPALTAEGWGPLRVGMTLADATRALGPDADPEAVGGPEPAVCDQFRPARAPEGLLVMVEEGRVSRISLIEGSAVKTERGLGIGAAASDVRAAYGAALVAEPHKYAEAPAEYLTIWDGGAKPPAYVEDPAARGLRYVIETGGKVATIHAGGPSIQYVEGCL